VKLVVIWRFVRGSCVLIHTAVCQETKTAEIMLKILGCNGTEFSRSRNPSPGVFFCTPVQQYHLPNAMQ